MTANILMKKIIFLLEFLTLITAINSLILLLHLQESFPLSFNQMEVMSKKGGLLESVVV